MREGHWDAPTLMALVDMHAEVHRPPDAEARVPNPLRNGYDVRLYSTPKGVRGSDYGPYGRPPSRRSISRSSWRRSRSLRALLRADWSSPTAACGWFWCARAWASSMASGPS